MATEITVQCAIDVATLLNAAPSGTFTMPTGYTFIAQRVYVPVFELAKNSNFNIYVCPTIPEQDLNFTRQSYEQDCEVDIAILWKLQKPENVTEIDAGLLVVQQVKDYLAAARNRNLPSGPKLMKMAHRPLFDAGVLREKQTLLSAVYPTYRGFWTPQ